MPESRTKIMGVINVTPDSFSDGGKWLDPKRAIAHGYELHAQGADLLDIGGESTRPGAHRISAQEELDRVLPVIEGLTGVGVPLSVDTTRSEVAAEALLAGAHIVNDVSGGQADPAMIDLVADRGCPFILSHWRGPSDVMNSLATYEDVLGDVSTELLRQVDVVLAGGMREEQIILDPGLGFAKDAPANWELLAGIDHLKGLGFPLLLGASRKRFLGELFANDPDYRGPGDRDQATAAITAIAAHHGVWGVRVHDVASSSDAAQVAQAITLARTSTAKEDR